MSRVIRIIAKVALCGLTMALVVCAQSSAWAQGESSLMVTDGVHKIHIMPTVRRTAEQPADNGPLIYHAGGVVMTGSLNFYAIYWIPAHLQNGGSTQMSTHYQNVQTNLLHDYPGHGLGNNNTQYYQTINGVTTYLLNRGGLAHTYVDTAAYPASGCQDPDTPGNCITDAQIQAEIQRVLNLKGWPKGLNNMYLLFTSSGEGSCFDSNPNDGCAYTDYCAYHGSFGSGANTVVYANEPYGDVNNCQEPGTPSPNNDPAADAANTSASHEITEAITDPNLDAWYTTQGNEIGDLCAYQYGTNTWDSGKANQKWNQHFFELQMEFDNHVGSTGSCQQIGP